jgi:hypothetical protein
MIYRNTWDSLLISAGLSQPISKIDLIFCTRSLKQPTLKTYIFGMKWLRQPRQKRSSQKQKSPAYSLVLDDRDQRAKIENLRRTLGCRCQNIRGVRIPDQLSRVLLWMTSVLSAIFLYHTVMTYPHSSHTTPGIGLLSFLSSGEEICLSLSLVLVLLVVSFLECYSR